MNKKGISIIMLAITVLVIVIMSSAVIYTGFNINEQTSFVIFEKSINLIEKTIRKEYIKGNIVGTNLQDYENNTNSEQDKFEFTQEELIEIIDDIKIIYPAILIDSEKSDYYLLDREDFITLGLNEIYDNYLVNYKKGFVFCLSPIIDEQGSKIYSTQYINNTNI